LGLLDEVHEPVAPGALPVQDGRRTDLRRAHHDRRAVLMIVWCGSAPLMPPARPVVLIVDDEPGIREIEAEALKGAGFAVLPVGSPASAMRLVEADMPVDLVIADLNMPGMTGDEMAVRMRRMRPDLKILFVT